MPKITIGHDAMPKNHFKIVFFNRFGLTHVGEGGGVPTDV